MQLMKQVLPRFISPLNPVVEFLLNPSLEKFSINFFFYK